MATFLHQMNGLLVGDVSSVVEAQCWVGRAVAPRGNGMSSFHACRRSTRKNVLNSARNLGFPPPKKQRGGDVLLTSQQSCVIDASYIERYGIEGDAS